MKKVLLFTTALSLSFIQHTSLAQSACVSTPSCAELGYNASSCPNGGLKCPFGNTWNCEITNYKDKITELEKELEDLEQNINELANCQIGDILYSDKTCSPDIVSGKTPIGVVFDNLRKKAISIDEQENIWSTEIRDIDNLASSYTSENINILSTSGKIHTKIALAYINLSNLQSSFPAFNYIINYSTEGTQSEDWYIPSINELSTIYNNRKYLNLTLGKINGTKLQLNRYWSSVEGSNYSVWLLSFSEGLIYKTNKASLAVVRPTISYEKWIKKDEDITSESPETQQCNIGDILYADKSCSPDDNSGKIPIGIIFDTTNRLAIGLEFSYELLANNNYNGINAPELNYSENKTEALSDKHGKNNTKIIIDYCQEKNYSCPAFEYVNSYKTKGTKTGDWYLPSLGELNAIYENKFIINQALIKIGVGKLPDDDHWSSSVVGHWTKTVWQQELQQGNIYASPSYLGAYIRPIIQF